MILRISLHLLLHVLTFFGSSSNRLHHLFLSQMSSSIKRSIILLIKSIWVILACSLADSDRISWHCPNCLFIKRKPGLLNASAIASKPVKSLNLLNGAMPWPSIQPPTLPSCSANVLALSMLGQGCNIRRGRSSSSNWGVQGHFLLSVVFWSFSLNSDWS